MTSPSLDFGAHDDVLFERAPLQTVLCQVKFPPIFALLDELGVAGLQEALRFDYPKTEFNRDVEIAVDAKQTQLRQKAPVWRMLTEDRVWTVSAAIDFVALETTSYPSFGEFSRRLDFLLAAVDRTLSPGRLTRLGIRKVNLLRREDVTSLSGWAEYLRPELMGLAIYKDLPGTIASSYSEWHLHDDAGGTLTIRAGMDPEEKHLFRLDFDYWTEAQHFEIEGGSELIELVTAYSKSITSCFHWALGSNIKRSFGPKPRQLG